MQLILAENMSDLRSQAKCIYVHPNDEDRDVVPWTPIDSAYPSFEGPAFDLTANKSLPEANNTVVVTTCHPSTVRAQANSSGLTVWL